MSFAVPSGQLSLAMAPVDGAFVGSAVLGMLVVNVELGLVATRLGAGVAFAIVRGALLLMQAALETALVSDAKVTSGCCEVSTALSGLGTRYMQVAVDGCPPIREAHARPAASSHQATGDVEIAVANAGAHCRAVAVGSHLAAVSPAEEAVPLQLGTMRASGDLTRDMCFAELEASPPQPCALRSYAPVVGADVREGLLLGPGGLHRAARGPAFPMERTVPVARVSRVDAEGGILVPRGLAGVFLAVGRVPSYSSDILIDVPPVAACHLAEPGGVAVDSHGVGYQDGVAVPPIRAGWASEACLSLLVGRLVVVNFPSSAPRVKSDVIVSCR